MARHLSYAAAPAGNKAREMSEGDWDLLDALWRRGPATAREVGEELAERRGWSYSTVKTLLDRAVTKGLVAARQVGNVWEYSPAIERAQARRSAWTGFVERAFGGALEPALRFVASQTKLSARERRKLREWLNAGGKEEDDE